jgi:hypothetical protein
MAEVLKPLVWLEGEIKTPPFTKEGRVEAGTLLLRLQRGESLGLPHSRPMPSIGKGCHELRDPSLTLRVGVDTNPKRKRGWKTPAPVIAACQRRLADYLAARGGGKASG